MEKIIYSAMVTLTGLVLLFSYRTSLDATTLTSAPVTDTTASTTTTAPTSGSSTPSPAATAGSTGTGAAASASGLSDGTFVGTATNTRYGAVQVQITVSSGIISAVSVPEYPQSNGRDRQINARAIPTLVSETTSAQSAKIDMVSGATYTSRGYIQSLQSAIDQASA